MSTQTAETPEAQTANNGLANNGVQLNNVQVERGEGGLVTLQIEVAPETVRAAREKVIKDFSRRIRVPGFRPGRIPANIVRRNVGDESIAQSVSDEIVPQAYQAALQQTDLQPLDRAQVDELTFDAFDGEKPLQFTARVIVRPEIELGDVKGLGVTQQKVEVTDEDVEKGLEELRSQRATAKDVEDRGAELGDMVSGELQVYIDGKPHSEEASQLRGFILGESGFIPEIDSHLVGAKLDEERRFTVTYPSDFKDEELAGQVAEFAVKVTALKEKVMPELTDEFAQSLGLENVAAVNERMRQAIQEGRTRESRDAVRTAIAEGAVALAHFETPGNLVHTRAHRRLENLEQEMVQRGGTLDQYLEGTGKTREEFDGDVHKEVEKEIRQELVLDEIAKREGLTVTNDEIENHYRQVAMAMQQPIERIVEHLDFETARASVLQRKAVDWLLENANITDEDGNVVEASSLEADAVSAVSEAEIEELIAEAEASEAIESEDEAAGTEDENAT
ncbi:MAG TPA: trigger factor, partial [Abditibacteriaceae bacterium]